MRRKEGIAGRHNIRLRPQVFGRQVKVDLLQRFAVQGVGGGNPGHDIDHADMEIADRDGFGTIEEIDRARARTFAIPFGDSGLCQIAFIPARRKKAGIGHSSKLLQGGG